MGLGFFFVGTKGEQLVKNGFVVDVSIAAVTLDLNLDRKSVG